MDWELIIDGERERLPDREAVLDRLRDLLEDHLATSPLADLEIRDPVGRPFDVDVGLRLLPGEE